MEFQKKHNLTQKHWGDKKIEDMTERDWRIFKEDFNITARGTDIPKPFRTWSESALPNELLDSVKSAGYLKPTPIQMQAIPIALRGRDILGTPQSLILLFINIFFHFLFFKSIKLIFSELFTYFLFFEFLKLFLGIF